MARSRRGCGIETIPPYSTARGVGYAVIIACLICAVFLVLVSLAEYLILPLDEDDAYLIVLGISIAGMLVGTCLTAKRIGRTGLRLGAISGLCYTAIAIVLSWCLGVSIEREWLISVIAICMISSILGAFVGILCRR